MPPVIKDFLKVKLVLDTTSIGKVAKTAKQRRDALDFCLDQAWAGLDVDTNVQNPTVAGIGAWGAGEIGKARNRKIFDERRFAIRATPVVQENGGRQGCKADSRVPKNANVRILAQSGVWSGVDVDEDGDADGQVRTADLTPSLATMPPWGPSS